MSIFKKSLDMSFLKNIKPRGSGTVGVYYGAFPKEQIKDIKRHLGQIDPNIGIKVFKQTVNYIQIIELLSLYFIAPEINKIGIKAPYTTQPLSIANFIHHRFIQPQHFQGKHLDDYDFPSNTIRDVTCDAIKDKLNSIGITWDDCWERNYLIPEYILSNLQKEWDEIKENFDSRSDAWSAFEARINPDLSDYAIIVDVGSMKCTKDSAAGQKILEWQNKIENFLQTKNTNQVLANCFFKAFEYILI